MEMTKTFKPTAEMVGAATAVFQAMAWEHTVQPIVESYQKKILVGMQAKNIFEPDDIITDPNRTYLMADDDFQYFMKRCNEEQEKAGLITEKADYCPLLVAKDFVKKAEHVLIETMEPTTKVSLDLITHHLEEYHKYIELTLQLLAPFVKVA